jgi:hypothetical protein
MEMNKIILNGVTYVKEEKPDPYALLKKAYAEGKTIQVKVHGSHTWTELSQPPSWYSLNEYRIKPQTVTKWLY